MRQKTDAISLMKVAAHTVLQTKWTDEEKNALPRRDDESWIGLYQEFLKLFSDYHYNLINWLGGVLIMLDQTKSQLYVEAAQEEDSILQFVKIS